MPGRSFSGTIGYRYGFNGKENDNEVKGVEGSQQDYGMRIYDPRLGRFLSSDPLTAKFPWWSPYHFAGNTPIQAIDQDGLETSFENVQHANDLARLHVSSSSENRKNYNKGVVMGMATGTALFAAVVTGSAAVPYMLQYGSRALVWAPTNIETIKFGTGLIAGMFYDGPDDLVSGANGDELIKAFRGTGTKVLDFFGGKVSKYVGAFNIDQVAKKGFKGTIAEFTAFMRNNKLLGTVNKIIVDNPYGYDGYLKDAADLLKSGGVITISGNMSNKYFNKILKGTMEGLENFDIIQDVTKVSNAGMKTTEGNQIVKDMYQIILKRK